MIDKLRLVICCENPGQICSELLLQYPAVVYRFSQTFPYFAILSYLSNSRFELGADWSVAEELLLLYP